MQSMMPPFRRSDSFGRIDIQSQLGHYPQANIEYPEMRAATNRHDNHGWLPYGAENSLRIGVHSNDAL